jgi:hypothetical protein
MLSMYWTTNAANDAKEIRAKPGNKPEDPQKATKETKTQPPSFSSFPSVQNLRALSDLSAAERPGSPTPRRRCLN